MLCPNCGSSNPVEVVACLRCSTPFPGDIMAGEAASEDAAQIVSTADEDTASQDLGGAPASFSSPVSEDAPTGFFSPVSAEAPTGFFGSVSAEAQTGWGDSVGADAGTLGAEAVSAGAAAGWSNPNPKLTAGVYSVTEPMGAPQPGTVLAGRYEIIALLGEGGMGAVYKAKDLELDRLIGLKVIRSELAQHPEVLRRFKQELILARDVTHENVVRIFDLGTSGSIKFLTMEFVEGRDLSGILEDGNELAPETVADIFEQTCRALQAAHKAGIVHRDLKPQNIMLDAEGRVKVMDFGVARSMELTSLTRTGQLIGTPDYMSPEQALGEKTDARSDLFALGIILYELLVGKLPFEADTPYGALLKRTQEDAPPPVKSDASIPDYLNKVVVKCLQKDLDLRYQSADEILEDLESRKAPSSPPRLALVPRQLRASSSVTRWAAVALLVLAVGVVALTATGRMSWTSPPTSSEIIDPESLAILPFKNASSDPSLDWLGPSLAEMLRSEVGQSASLRTVPTDRLHQILQDLRIQPNTTLDPIGLRRLGEFSNADSVVWGQFMKVGQQVRLDARVYDLERDTTVPIKAEAASEEELLEVVGQLAVLIRENLDISSEVAAELEDNAFRPSSSSIQAIRLYNEGLQLERQGNYLEAVDRLQAAVDEDSTFALAFASLARAHSSLGYDDEAERSSRRAVELSADLALHQRYLINANHAWILADHEAATTAYENLLEIVPGDPSVHFRLAGLYEQTGDFDRARQHYARVLEFDPNYVDALFSQGRNETRSGNPQDAIDPLNRALALAIDLENDEARGRVLNAIGSAYQELDRPEEALRNFEESLEIHRRLGEKMGIATTQESIAGVHEYLEDYDLALAHHQEALQLRLEIGDRQGIGDSLMSLGSLHARGGDVEEALRLHKESLQVQRELGSESGEARSLQAIGAVYLAAGEFGDALIYFEQALDIRKQTRAPRDVAETHHSLGEASVRLGRYDTALENYDQALVEHRAAGDDLGAVADLYGKATVLLWQSRLAEAEQTGREALETIERLGVEGAWAVKVNVLVGETLSQTGRLDEASLNLGNALDLAKRLEDSALVARALNAMASSRLHAMDPEAAERLYLEGKQAGVEGSGREAELAAGIQLTRIDVLQGRHEKALSSLRAAAEEADSRGFTYLATECSVIIAETLLELRDSQQARHELGSVITTTDRLGLRELQARAHLLLARLEASEGNEAGMKRGYRQAARLLEEIRKDAAPADPLHRPDMGALYAEATGAL